MPDSLLTPEDLAYMRETQASTRPTEADLARKVTVRTPTGGTTSGYPSSEPVAVRITSSPDEVPAVLAAQYEGGTLAKVTMDLVHDVRSGDRLTVSPTEVYEFVSDGTPDEWATAQIAWARRTVHPAR